MDTLLNRAALILVSVSSLVAGASGQIKFTNAAKTYSVKLGGRIHNDWAVISGDNALIADIDPLEFEDGNEFRRARLYVSGDVWGSMFFKAQYDFEDGVADFKDVYMGIRTPAGSLKIGQFKEGFSLEQLQSSNHLTFIERSNHDSFSPARNTGFQLSDTASDGRFYWAVGMFRDTDKFGDSKGDGEYNFTVRVAGTPMYEDGGKRMVHLGASISVRSPNDNSVSFVDNEEVNLAPNIASTGTIASDGVMLINLEAAWVRDAVSVQAEHAFVEVNAATLGASNPSFSGTYIQVAYTLTGETRSYKQSAAVFGTISPAENYDPASGGSGAWEVAFRYSMLDLNDAGIAGGEIDSLTLGVNWYLNPNARIMLNLVQSDLDGVGDYQAAVARFQLTF